MKKPKRKPKKKEPEYVMTMNGKPVVNVVRVVRVTLRSGG